MRGVAAAVIPSASVDLRLTGSIFSSQMFDQEANWSVLSRAGHKSNQPSTWIIMVTSCRRRSLLLGMASAVVSIARPVFGAPVNATLYKDPACGCCGSYATHLRVNGFAVEVVATPEFAEVGRKA